MNTKYDINQIIQVPYKVIGIHINDGAEEYTLRCDTSDYKTATGAKVKDLIYTADEE